MFCMQISEIKSIIFCVSTASGFNLIFNNVSGSSHQSYWLSKVLSMMVLFLYIILKWGDTLRALTCILLLALNFTSVNFCTVKRQQALNYAVIQFFMVFNVFPPFLQFTSQKSSLIPPSCQPSTVKHFSLMNRHRIAIHQSSSILYFSLSVEWVLLAFPPDVFFCRSPLLVVTVVN